MTIRAVFFDFDGTVADTLPLSFRAFQEVFHRYDGRNVTKEEIIAMFGPSEEGILSQNLTRPESVPEAIRDYYEIYREGHESKECSPNPEIIELLQDLQKQGLHLAIITGKGRKSYDISAQRLGLSSYFDVVITGDDVRKPKPHPEGIERAMELLGVNAEETVFLGDSSADIQAGKEAGLRTYGVQWLSTYQSSEFEVLPDAVFRTAREFRELLKVR